MGYAHYLPWTGIQLLHNSAHTEAASTEETLHVAALFADLSGFTKLTEQMEQFGAEGPERLASVLNGSLEPIVDCILEHGGDIVHFAGDALLAIWPTQDPAQKLVVSTIHAIICGHAMQEQLRQFNERVGLSLGMRVGVSCGTLRLACLGGLFGRKEFITLGPAMNHAIAAEGEASTGGVAVEQGAWEAIQQHSPGLFQGTLRDRFVHLESITSVIPASQTENVLVPEVAIDVARSFIPNAVRTRLDAGYAKWLAELRAVTVVFVHLPALNDTIELSHAQEVMMDLQSCIYDYEGSVNKLMVDNKGAVLIAVFGLPPLAHEDDPLRAVHSAIAMQTRMKRKGWEASIGVASGTVFCGEVGSPQRLEYTVLGTTVNLSARLMQAAKKGILCDLATHDKLGNRVDTIPLQPITLKGIAEPVSVFRCLGKSKESVMSMILKPLMDGESRHYGRREETQLLEDRLEVLMDGGRPGLVILTGEAGIGKTHFVRHFQGIAAGFDAKVLTGRVDALERSRPYYAWRHVFRKILGLSRKNRDRWHAIAKATLSTFPGLESMAPLLNPVLPIDVPDNEATAAMTSQARAESTHTLLMTLLRQACQQPLVIMLEDAHWFDSASWALALEAYTELESLLLLLTTRPMTAPLPQAYEILAQSAHHLNLKGLPREAIQTLVADHLNAQSLPSEVTDLLLEHGEGNPFFSQNLAQSLLDDGYIQIQNNRCKLKVSVEELQQIRLPDTVQGLVRSRIDRLPPTQQMCLKIASVLGRTFSVSIIEGIYTAAGGIGTPNLPEVFDALQKVHLTEEVATTPQLIHQFQDAITQRVVYDLMLFAQRRQTHAAILAWYEQYGTGDLSRNLPMLVQHSRGAEDHNKTILYLEHVGEQAQSTFAVDEVLSVFREIIALAETHRPSDLTELRKARWHRNLGKAYLAQGELTEAKEQFIEALALLGSSLPGSQRALKLAVTWKSMQQYLHVTMPSFFARGTSQSERRQVIMECLVHLTEIFYYLTDGQQVAYTTLTAINMAQRLTTTPEHSIAYTNASRWASSAMGVGAEPYRKKALDIGKEWDDPNAVTYAFVSNGLLRMGEGQWESAGRFFQESLDISERVGYRRRYDVASTYLACIHFFLGHFHHSRPIMHRLLTSSKRRNDQQSQLFSMAGVAQAALAQGRALEALDIMHQASQFSMTQQQGVSAIWCGGLLALAYLRTHKSDEALDTALRTMTYIQRSEPTAPFPLEGYSATAEVLLRYVDGTPHLDATKRKDILNVAQKACQALQNMATSFPICRPRHALWNGLRLFLLGQTSKARKQWYKGLAEAERLEMPWDQALFHWELSFRGDEANQETHRDEAYAWLNSLEVPPPSHEEGPAQPPPVLQLTRTVIV